MGNFEFVKYEATPGEKHLGIATVKAYGRIVLRYKIVPNKDGSGFFPAAASYKLPSHGGEDAYISAFLLDSRSEEEELNAMIRASVKEAIKRQAPSNSVFASASDEVPF